MSDDSMAESVFGDDGSSDFVPDEAPKPKAKAPAKKAAPKKQTQTKLTAKPAAKGKKKAKADSEDEMTDHGDPFDDDSLLSQTPPKKTQTVAATKKGGSKPLANVENDSISIDGGDSSKEVKASDKYKMLSHLEHIVKRPDTYIGSVERTSQEMWVYNSEMEGMEFREVSYVPGLYKIFDEIVVNAADNKQNDKNMDEIRVTYSRETGVISVWNNGKGIPVEIHDEKGIYIPEMIFGNLLTSSNYDDDKAKITGGRNGFGAKLCNVFSTEFTVETQDSKQMKRYRQTWTNNMQTLGKPKITTAKGSDYTQVTFKADFEKFGMEGIDDDFEALLKRRVYDLAGTTGVTVKLNGTRVPIRNFKKYMEMYTKAIRRDRGDDDSKSDPIITCVPHPYWEIGFAVSDGSFKQVSFVNSIATTSGGTHVNFIADQIAGKLAESLKKNKKGTGSILKTAQIRNYCFLFVNSKIVNPAFNSQTKEQLTTKSTQFGSKPTLDDAFLKKVANSGVLDSLKKFADHKADLMLKKSDGGRRSRMNNPKLTDANKAGTKDGYRCTLILTEGESAKGLAMAGRGVVGADLFGVYPLRGKMLNVRDASFDQISKNEEIQSIKNFMGLQHKKEYSDTRGLRYGHLMIMTDQDHDGSHIKGLIINFLQAQFPSLLKIPEFLIEFITPIVKVWKGDIKNPTKSVSFFTLQEYEAWREKHGHERGWEHKYYKGLGTSSTEEAMDYFRDLDRHLKEFHTLQDEEVQLIELAFSKKKIEERKEWLRQFKPGTFMDHSVDKISYTDFINKELIQFSMADNIRSIPSVVDGMKPGQRKVMYTVLKRNIKKDTKVLDLTGQVLSIAAYHHGDASMHQTIIGLAQDFVGSNNINTLEPSGNFGSRLKGGSDASSARYIHTRLSPFARRVYHPHDDPILTHCFDDGQVVEPETYIPVVPMVLINGADGIGTGWSSTIPNYNPEDIVDNLKRMMNGEEPKPMQPWFKGFKGEVTQLGPDRFKFSGIIKQISEKEVEVTELPVRTWTQDFINKLEEMIKADKTPSLIKDYRDYNTNSDVNMVLQLDEKNIKAPLTQEFLEEKFKLSKTVATSNLVAFDPEGRITKYNSVEDILKEFFALRLKTYERRKQYQLGQLQTELEKLTNQARFVQMIIDGELIVSKKKKTALVAELKDKGFKAFPKVSDAAKAGETEKVVEASEDEDEDDDTQNLAHAYDYLLGMAIWSLTQERVERLRRQIGDKEVEIDELIKLSKEDIWNRDLDDFINEWRYQLQETDRRRRGLASKGRRTSSKLATGGGRAAAATKKRKAAGDDSDDDFVVSKSKKKTAAKKEPAGGIMSFLNKAPKKPSPAAADSDSDSDFDFGDEEVMPKKSRGAKKPSPKPKDEDGDIDMDASDEEIIPTKSRATKAAPKAASKPKDEDEDEDIKPKPANKRGRPAASAKPKPKDDDSEALDDDDFMEITKTEAAKTAPASRGGRSKPAPKYTLDDSDSDNGDDLLGDVGKMVKGIGGATGRSASDSRQLFSETSRPGSSTGLTTSAKASKFSNDFDPDETDYSKLIPQNSPRRSLQVKPKEKTSDSVDLEDDEEPVKPAKGKAASTKAKAAPAPKSTTGKGRGRPKKDAAATTSAAPKQTTLSPAAKAYASKQAKAAPKKKSIMDDSEDDIDAMANDILDSPAGVRDEAPARSTASRPSRRTTTKKSYVIEDDDSDDSGDGQDDSFDLSD
ncbi:DNA topoisomerase 2 [Aspergillus undulatus]|uniref:DNA topoisomerase 2 n=1 Tax=Aspergillus undulatus TaxID=1810928 RepID=UPI003CCE430D